MILALPRVERMFSSFVDPVSGRAIHFAGQRPYTPGHKSLLAS